MNLKSLCFLILLFQNITLVAEGKKRGNTSCDHLLTSRDLIRCVVENHSKVRLSKEALKSFELAKDVASQIPNPELSVDGIESGGGYVSEFTLTHTFELGGKRKAREDLAESRFLVQKAQYQITKEQVVIELVLNLYRLRQIAHEIEAIQENLKTFQSVKNQYKKLVRMSPEQSFSLSIFKIASEENSLRLAQLRAEKEKIQSDIFLSVGRSFIIKKNLLPKVNVKWPKIGAPKYEGGVFKKLQQEVALSKSEYGLEKSISWPDLSLGPKFEVVTGNEAQTRVGFSLTLPLPLFHVNGAGRARALSELRRSELQSKIYKEQLRVKRSYFLKLYNSVTRSLQKSRQRSGISKRHSQLHKMLNRGVVQPALIIELHREIKDFYERIHEQELQAVEAQWRIYAMDGTLFQESL